MALSTKQKKHMDKNKDGKISTVDFKMMTKKSGGKTSKFKDGDDTHVTKDGRTVKKGLYYYMNKRKNSGKSRKGKGTVSDKALKQSKKTAHHSK